MRRKSVYEEIVSPVHVGGLNLLLVLCAFLGSVSVKTGIRSRHSELSAVYYGTAQSKAKDTCLPSWPDPCF